MRAQNRLQRLLAAILVAGAAACGGSPGEAPDVIVIVLDTTRGDHCSINGYGRPTTPRLAELAKSSVTFTDAWAPAPHTGPSHGTLFTGLRPENHGFTETPAARHFLDESAETLAEVLHAAGYRTAAWSNNATVSSDFGLAQGFDEFHRLWERPPRYPWSRETHKMALRWAVERAMAGERYFAFINDMEPHAPYTPTEATEGTFIAPEATYDEIERAREFTFPASLGYMLGEVEVSQRRFAVLQSLYDAEIAEVDAAVGELVEGLRAAGRLDDTLIVVCGDHGEEFGEHKLAEHGFGAYRTLLHVPLLVRLPRRYEGGRKVTTPVRLEDVMPTILDACGIDAPGDLDGAPLSDTSAPRVALGGFGPNPRYAQIAKINFPQSDLTMFGHKWNSVYDGTFHLVTRSDGLLQLFRPADDPLEQKDLSAAEPAARAKLEALLPR